MMPDMTDNPMTERRFLSIPDAAEYLGNAGITVDRTTIYQWVRNGKLPAIRLPGGGFRIAENDLEALLEPKLQGGAA